ncbi:hypothetical protein ACFL35_08155 [Candidatus Riflebacteria bacterium]
MERFDEFSVADYIKYMARTYPGICRIHYFVGQLKDVPLLVCELFSSKFCPADFKNESWICDNFLDLYFLAPAKSWLNKCQHLNENLVLVPERIENLNYFLAFEKDFGFFPLSLSKKPPVDFSLKS